MIIVCYPNNSILTRNNNGIRIDANYSFAEIQSKYNVPMIRNGDARYPVKRTVDDVTLILWNTVTLPKPKPDYSALKKKRIAKQIQEAYVLKTL